MSQQLAGIGNVSIDSPLIAPSDTLLGRVYGVLRAGRAPGRDAAAHVVGMSADTIPDLMTTEQLADYRQIPVRTLEDWRSPRRKTGPRWIRLGKRIRHRRATVDAWLER